MIQTFFEWVEVESYEPETPCTMVDSTSHVNDLVGEARRRGWCEHELMYHIFQYGVPEGFYSMEAHMKAMASVDESAETVLRGRRILELAAEEDEANSVVFPGGVLHEDNASVPESSSSPWQWPWAASGEINMWNPLLSAVTDVFSGPILDDMVSEVDMGRLAMTCHFSLDVLCMEMHQPHDFLPQVLCLDLVGKACVPPEPVKSVQILFRGGHGLGVWDIEPHMTLAQWFSGGKQGGNLDGYFSTIGGRILNSEAEVCNLGLGNLAEVVFHGRLRGGSFAGVGQGGGVPGLEQDGVSLPKSGVGVDASDGAQTGDSKTQRDRIIEAVEVLRLRI